MKQFLFIAALVFASATAQAAGVPSTPGPEMMKYAAEQSVVTYALFRVGALGSSNPSPKSVCLLTGAAASGLLVLQASGMTEDQIDQVFAGLNQMKITMAQVRAQLKADTEDCMKQ